MECKEEIYADGVGRLHYAKDMVHFEFMSLEPGKNGAAPTPVQTVRMLMPPQGFLRTFSSMEQLMEKLIAAGVLKTNPAPAKKAAAGAKASAKASAAGKKKSKGKK